MSRLLFMLLVLAPTLAVAQPHLDAPIFGAGASLQKSRSCTSVAGPAAGALSGRMPVTLTHCATAHEVALMAGRGTPPAIGQTASIDRR